MPAEIIDMETPPAETTSAPLPWIGATEAAPVGKNASKQAWTITLSEFAVVGVAYYNTAFDRWRCRIRMNLVRWYFILPSLIMPVIVMIPNSVTFLGKMTTATGAELKVVTVALAVAFASGQVLLASALFIAVIHAIIVLVTPRKNNHDNITYLLPHALHTRYADKVMETPWNQIAYVREQGGDLLFVERLSWVRRIHFMLPASASGRPGATPSMSYPR